MLFRKTTFPELIAEDDNGNMKFILERNGFDIGGYNGETYIKSSYSGYRSRILMADSRSSDTLYFSDDLKADKNGLEIYLRAEIIPIGRCFLCQIDLLCGKYNR